MRKGWGIRVVVVTLMLVASISGANRVSLAEGGVEQRIADFWKRIDAMQPGDYLRAADLGQWALNVTQRDPGAGLTVADFRASTAAMQEALDRAGIGVAPGTPRSADVEDRIALFWKRLEPLGQSDILSAADLGQWALNVTDRDPNKRIRVDDFRSSTAGMQRSIEGARTLPRPSTPGRAGYRPKPDCDAANSQITYEFTPAVTQAYRDAIKAGAELAARYIKLKFNDTICGAKMGGWSYLAGDTPPADIGGIGFSCCQSLPYLRSTPAQRTFWLDVSHRNLSVVTGVASIVARGYLLMWQDWLGCFFGQPDSVVIRNAPVWHQVGFTEYITDQALRDAGYGSSAISADQYLAIAKQGRDVLLLRDMVAEHPLDTARSQYKLQIGYVAFTQLVARAGYDKTIQFCRRVGQGEPWENAFGSTFGISVPAFYQEFSAYLARP